MLSTVFQLADSTEDDLERALSLEQHGMKGVVSVFCARKDVSRCRQVGRVGCCTAVANLSQARKALMSIMKDASSNVCKMEAYLALERTSAFHHRCLQRFSGVGAAKQQHSPQGMLMGETLWRDSEDRNPAVRCCAIRCLALLTPLNNLRDMAWERLHKVSAKLRAPKAAGEANRPVPCRRHWRGILTHL